MIFCVNRNKNVSAALGERWCVLDAEKDVKWSASMEEVSCSRCSEGPVQGKQNGSSSVHFLPWKQRGKRPKVSAATSSGLFPSKHPLHESNVLFTERAPSTRRRLASPTPPLRTRAGQDLRRVLVTVAGHYQTAVTLKALWLLNAEKLQGRTNKQPGFIRSYF